MSQLDNVVFWTQCIEAHLSQGQGGEGRVLGRFNHHRAAGCQGGPHLPRDHGAGKIPLDQKREEVSERKGYDRDKQGLCKPQGAAASRLGGWGLSGAGAENVSWRK